MGLDIRLPIGMMFSLLGAMLAVYGGATSGSPVYGRSLGFNVNLAWGAVLFLFGAVMLCLALRDRARRK